MSKLKTSRCCTQTRQQISQSACYCSASCQPTHSASFFTDNLCLHLRNARTRLTCPRVLRGTPGAWALFGFGLYVGLNGQNNTFVLLCCLILFCWIWNTLMRACISNLHLTILIWNKVEAVLYGMHLVILNQDWQYKSPWLGFCFESYWQIENWSGLAVSLLFSIYPPVLLQFWNLEDASVIMCW